MHVANDKDGLNPQKRLFCKAFILTGSLQQSAKIAYPDISKGFSEVKGNRLMKDAAVIKYLKELEIKTQGTMDETVRKKQKILDELELVGFSDPRNIFSKSSEEGKNLAEMGEAAKTISTIKIITENIGEIVIRKTVEYRFHDKLKALELRGKNLKLYTEVMEAGEIVNPTPYRLPDNGMREEVRV